MRFFGYRPVLVAWCVLVATAHAETIREFQARIRSRSDRDISEQALRGIVSLLETAEAQGIPVQPLISKVDEGLAKRQSLQSIECAAQERLARFRTAFALVAGTKKTTDPGNPRRLQIVDGLVEAMERGVQPEILSHAWKTMEPQFRAGTLKAEQWDCLVDDLITGRMSGTDSAVTVHPPPNRLPPGHQTKTRQPHEIDGHSEEIRELAERKMENSEQAARKREEAAARKGAERAARAAEKPRHKAEKRAEKQEDKQAEKKTRRDK